MSCIYTFSCLHGGIRDRMCRYLTGTTRGCRRKNTDCGLGTARLDNPDNTCLEGRFGDKKKVLFSVKAMADEYARQELFTLRLNFVHGIGLFDCDEPSRAARRDGDGSGSRFYLISHFP